MGFKARTVNFNVEVRVKMNKIRFLMFITMAAFAAALYCCRLPEVESQFNMKVLLPLAAGGNPPVTEYIISVSLKGNKYEAHKLFSSTSRTIKMAAPIDEEITISIAAFPAAPSETPTLYFGNFPVNKTERYKVEPINNNVSIELLESQKEMAEGGMIFFIPGTGGSWDEMHVFEFTASNAVQYLTFKKNGIETAPNIYGRLLVVGGGGAGGSSSGVALGAGGGGGGAAVIIDDNFRFNSAKYRIT
ncbi:MAG: hypothetical protein LBG79_05735, partial [Spirochaetaceae bacterium]|nr:hypothetical protein [Spirochaetaceae bacterium]